MNRMFPLITIIIPSHNNAELLSKTLASFVSQASDNYEIIVVDNNSNDDSIARVQRAYREKVDLTLIHQPRLAHPFALCRARNTGLKVARGEWIVVMDADTIPNHKYVLALETFINGHRDKPVIASCERVFVSSATVTDNDIEAHPEVLAKLPLVSSPSNYGRSTDRRLPAMKTLPEIEHPWDYMHGCNVVFRKQDALAIGGYDEAYDGRWGFEDIDFAYRMVTERRCTPLYVEGLQVFHQDLEGDKTHKERLDKGGNPNWKRVCSRIPGYEQYKVDKYRALSADIKV